MTTITQLAGLQFYICPHKPKTVFSGQVSTGPSDPYINITWDNGATGTLATSGAPEEGDTVHFGSTAGTSDIGITRVRSWTPAGPTDSTTGTLKIAETDDVGPQIANNNHITVKQEKRLWPRNPRQTLSGTTVSFFEDYDVAFTDQTENWYPTAVAPPPAVVFMETGGSVTVSFVGDRSTVHAPGASLSSYLWTAHGATSATSTSIGTEGSPVTFTWNSTGQFMVTFRVTDSNGKSHTTTTWVFVIDAGAPEDVAFIAYDRCSDSFDFDQGGGEGAFTVHENAPESTFARDAMVVVASRGELDTTTGYFPFRTNVHFVGYIVGSSISQDPDHSTTTFRASSVNRLMNSIKTFPVSMTDVVSPTEWVQAKSMTVDRIAAYLFTWRSTLATMTPCIFSGYSPLVFRQDFGPSTLLQQLTGQLLGDSWCKLAVNHQGVLYIQIDYNWMLTAERSALSTRKTLQKGVWIGPVSIAERADYDLPASKIKASGVAYSGGGDVNNVTPLFSEAPGDLHRAFGRESGGGRFVLNNQTDLNIRCGFMLSKQNLRYSNVQMRFLNDGAFTVAPQEKFPAVILPGDNARGLSWTPTLIPRRVRRTYNHEAGFVDSTVEFEPDATGPAGITVEIEQPEQFFEPVIDTSLTDQGIFAWSPEGSTYFHTIAIGSTWDDRNPGLSGDDLLDHYGGIDPFWRVQSGSDDADDTIIFKEVTEAIHRSTNAGRTSWTDITPTGTASGAEYVGMDSNLFTISTHYMIVRWLVTGTYQSSVVKTVNDGTSWDWGTIT